MGILPHSKAISWMLTKICQDTELQQQSEKMLLELEINCAQFKYTYIDRFKYAVISPSRY